MRSRWFAPLLGATVALTSACHHAPRPGADAAPARGELRLAGQRVVPDSGEIPREDLPLLAARVARLRLEPASLTLRVGDTVLVRERVRVLALDSAGTSLGRLPVYDSRLPPGAAALAGLGQVAGRQPGVSELEIGFPRMLWRDRADPPPVARLRIEVRD